MCMPLTESAATLIAARAGRPQSAAVADAMMLFSTFAADEPPVNASELPHEPIIVLLVTMTPVAPSTETSDAF